MFTQELGSFVDSPLLGPASKLGKRPFKEINDPLYLDCSKFISKFGKTDGSCSKGLNKSTKEENSAMKLDEMSDISSLSGSSDDEGFDLQPHPENMHEGQSYDWQKEKKRLKSG